MSDPPAIPLDDPGFDPGPLVRAALREDLGPTGDVTTAAVVPPDARGHGEIVAREGLVLAGLPVAAEVFRQLDDRVQLQPLARDGDRCEPGRTVALLDGPLAAVLSAERVALNFLQRLSGIATHTARFVALLGDRGVRLLDTRKTTPGLRIAEKYAVRVGGGRNHRFGLFDGVLIKDNHIRAAGSVTTAVRRARDGAHALLRIEVEVESLAEAREAIAAGADALLLDNRTPDELGELVRTLRELAPGVLLEASGGVTLDNVDAIAASGVDAVSSGAVIHGARWVDLALDLTP